MKINVNNLQKFHKVYQKQQENSPVNKNSKQNEDSMQISSRGMFLKEIQTELARTPEVRQEKVAEIKEAIDSGNYQVDSRQLARKLLDQEGQE